VTIGICIGVVVCIVVRSLTQVMDKMASYITLDTVEQDVNDNGIDELETSLTDQKHTASYVICI